MIQTGPDGALWVADMYRARDRAPGVDPDGLAEEARPARRARQGPDLPRLSRSARSPRPIPRLDKLDTAGLVAALDSPSGWQRDTAQHAPGRWQERTTPPSARRNSRETPNPLARLHALCTLDGLGELPTAADVRRGLADANAGVRRQAVRLARGLLASTPARSAAPLERVTDTDLKVRLELASAARRPAPRRGRSCPGPNTSCRTRRRVRAGRRPQLAQRQERRRHPDSSPRR